MRPFDDGVLFAVIDGLGHGREAAVVARRAATILEDHAGEPVSTLVDRCDERLRRTRGVVMGLACLSGESAALAWLGVGGVGGLVLRAGTPLAQPFVQWMRSHAGVVGTLRAPRPPAVVVPVRPADVLVVVSDGIDPAFADDLPGRWPVQPMAEDILSRHARPTDDATVLVARYLGSASGPGPASGP